MFGLKILLICTERVGGVLCWGVNGVNINNLDNYGIVFELIGYV